MKAASFVRQLASVRLNDGFNPYGESCERFDIEGASAIRSRSLKSLLIEAESSGVDALWIGRDLGHRGGRRTGLAFTDDVHLALHGARWNVELERPTSGPMVGELTATIVWKTLSQIRGSIFLWNVFPFHPHDHRRPFSNRAHTRAERQLGEEILIELSRILRPKRIVGVGRVAEETAEKLFPKKSPVGVRHPSHGGQKQFVRQILELHDHS